MSHTPGPWSHSDFELSSDHEDEVTITDQEACVSLAQVLAIGHREERNANARLMTSSPDLLAACDMALKYCWRGVPQRDKDPVFQQLSAAIEKATGLVPELAE